MKQQKITIFWILCLFTLLQIIFCSEYCGPHNCYELLGVSRDSDEQQIKKAYREIARTMHPDKNKEKDTTQIFQFINRAYEILTDERQKFKYDLYLANPTDSEYYRQYRYYEHKYIQNPQIHPAIVISMIIFIASTLQFIMRKQMYERAIEGITNGHDFRVKVNEKSQGNKKAKDKIREEMIKEIQIEGGYSKPEVKDLLFAKIILFPVNMVIWLGSTSKWIWNYKILRKPYSLEDQEILTISALHIKRNRWENIDSTERNILLTRQLWKKGNKDQYDQEMKQKWLDQLKQDNPNKYNMVMKHMKKQQ